MGWGGGGSLPLGDLRRRLPSQTRRTLQRQRHIVCTSSCGRVLSLQGSQDGTQAADSSKLEALDWSSVGGDGIPHRISCGLRTSRPLLHGGPTVVQRKGGRFFRDWTVLTIGVQRVFLSRDRGYRGGGRSWARSTSGREKRCPEITYVATGDRLPIKGVNLALCDLLVESVSGCSSGARTSGCLTAGATAQGLANVTNGVATLCGVIVHQSRKERGEKDATISNESGLSTATADLPGRVNKVCIA